jgi:hypothetical protein
MASKLRKPPGDLLNSQLNSINYEHGEILTYEFTQM